jgi:hypothetical protein
MNKTDRFWTAENIFILLGLLIAQILLFNILIKDDTPGPLSALSIFVWVGGTAAAIIFHIILFFVSSRKFLFGIALLLCVLFWTVVWPSYDYWQHTKSTRERRKVSGQFIERQESGKIQVEKLLREKNIFYEWLPDSLCYRILREDGTYYYITSGSADGEGITAYETMTTRLSLKDTAAWIRGLKNIIPLLNNQQLSSLNKSLKDRTFCLSRAYQGYSCAFPCWRIVVSQRYDSLTKQFYTSMHLPY